MLLDTETYEFKKTATTSIRLYPDKSNKNNHTVNFIFNGK